jgi:hypothetical protein
LFPNRDDGDQHEPENAHRPESDEEDMLELIELPGGDDEPDSVVSGDEESKYIGMDEIVRELTCLAQALGQTEGPVNMFEFWLKGELSSDVLNADQQELLAFWNKLKEEYPELSLLAQIACSLLSASGGCR